MHKQQKTIDRLVQGKTFIMKTYLLNLILIAIFSLTFSAKLEAGEKPLLILLHALGLNGSAQELYWSSISGFHLDPYMRDHFEIYAPNGKLLPQDSANPIFQQVSGLLAIGGLGRYWDSTDATGATGLEKGDWGLKTIEEIFVNNRHRDIYIAGHSSGGAMAYRVLCEKSRIYSNLKAIAVVAASMTQSELESCDPRPGIRLVHFHDRSDGVFKLGGGNMGSLAKAVIPGGSSLPDYVSVHDLKSSLSPKIAQFELIVKDNYSSILHLLLGSLRGIVAHVMPATGLDFRSFFLTSVYDDDTLLANGVC